MSKEVEIVEDKQEYFQKSLIDNLEKFSLDSDDKLIWRLKRFTQILREWNSIHNLTSNSSFDAILENIIDSLYPLKFIPKPKSLLDVGTGAGFPGLIIACFWDDVPTLLCEPLNKRSSFLRYASLELELDNVRVVRKRVEQLKEPPFNLISSRAVSDTNMLLDLTKEISNQNSSYLFYKGSRVSQEVKSLKRELKVEIIKRATRQYLLLIPKK